MSRLSFQLESTLAAPSAISAPPLASTLERIYKKKKEEEQKSAPSAISAAATWPNFREDLGARAVARGAFCAASNKL